MIESLALVAKEIANSIGESAMDAVKAEIAELPDKIGELSELELLPDKVELVTEEDYQIVFEKNTARNEGSDEATDPIKAERESVDNTRDLTEDEKQWLKDVLGWNDNQIAKCTIDENGIIHYRTDRCDLEGKTSDYQMYLSTLLHLYFKFPNKTKKELNIVLLFYILFIVSTSS